MTAKSEVEAFEDHSFGAPAVRGFLHRPARDSDAALVLTHGAGSDCRAPLLFTVATCFAAHGFTVLRCDLPFRQARRHGPPIRTNAEDRQGLLHAVSALKKVTNGRVFLGGHSYGGRQATILVTERQVVLD